MKTAIRVSLEIASGIAQVACVVLAGVGVSSLVAREQCCVSWEQFGQDFRHAQQHDSNAFLLPELRSKYLGKKVRWRVEVTPVVSRKHADHAGKKQRNLWAVSEVNGNVCGPTCHFYGDTSGIADGKTCFVEVEGVVSYVDGLLGAEVDATGIWPTR